MNYGWLRLVTAHLPGGRPSCKKRRGSRTRRQPSSRHARRCGFPRVPGVRNPAPYKYENTRVGWRHGCVEGGVIRFSGGSESCVHRNPGADDGLCCLSRCRVDSTHSLPQHALLGAKPNHGFSRCQHLRATFFSSAGMPGRRRKADATPAPHRDRKHQMHSMDTRPKKTSVKRAFSSWRLRLSASGAMTTSTRPDRRCLFERLERRLKKTFRRGFRFRVAQAGLRRTAQTFFLPATTMSPPSAPVASTSNAIARHRRRASDHLSRPSGSCGTRAPFVGRNAGIHRHASRRRRLAHRYRCIRRPTRALQKRNGEPATARISAVADSPQGDCPWTDLSDRRLRSARRSRRVTAAR